MEESVDGALFWEGTTTDALARNNITRILARLVPLTKYLASSSGGDVGVWKDMSLIID